MRPAGRSVAAFFWRYFRRYLPWVAVALVGVLVFAMASTVLVSLIEPIFGEVLLAGDGMPGPLAPAGGDEEGSPGEFVGFGLKERLDEGYRDLKSRLGIEGREVVWFVPLLFIAGFFVRSMADFASGYSFQRIGLGVTTDVRNDLYGRILYQSSRFHAQHPSGELVSRVVSDVALMQTAVSNRLLDFVQQSVTLLFLLWLLLSTHLRLALICLVLTPALLYPIVRFGRGMRRSSHRSQERMADLASLVTEGVRGHRVVKAFGMEGFEKARFGRATRRHLKVNLWAQMLSHLSGPVVESLAVLGAAGLLIYAGLQIRSGQLSAPILVSFLTNLLLMYDPVRKLNRVNLMLQQSLAAAQRVVEIMAVDNEITERDGARAHGTVEEGIAFEKVSFSYGEGPVLRGVDLRLRRGEIVALVGPSGAGKSTLVNLLPRFFDADEGRVNIDGIDIRDLKLSSLRALIGIVTQETVLFNDTVRNNIAYGRGNVPLERVREAAAAAYADEFIIELPRGYETTIGEAGLRLSGGQRQRIAIARALFKNAPILILDEATSQLDAESEAYVQKALSNLMQGRTTLVIAHRLSTVARADRIVVLEGGRVIEEGSHRDLLARGGLYKRLHDLQFRS
jgi:subfamily B ATP-binding cassette protein MsbA